MDLTGKFALVTGAVGGIGRASVMRLARAGASVCVNDLAARESEALDVVRMCAERGVDAFFHAADVSDETAAVEMTAAVAGRWGRIDILVSNAGISGAGPAFPDLSAESWERMLTVNLTSHFLVTRSVLPVMAKAGYGRVVTVSSVGGISGIIPCNAHYAAAKGGIVALTKRLARDYAPFGVTVNCVAPGFVHDTGFNENISGDKLRFYVSQIPLGRAGRAEDISGVIAFLASEEADWMTGQVIAVDGGATC